MAQHNVSVTVCNCQSCIGINQFKNMKRKLQLLDSSIYERISEINRCIGVVNEHVFPQTDMNNMRMTANTPSALSLTVSTACSFFCCSISELENVHKFFTTVQDFIVLIMMSLSNHIFWDVMLRDVCDSQLPKHTTFL
jgi:hypothetical protein